MGDEMDQLKKQKTWNLVDLPPNRKALKTRWVYKIKTDQNRLKQLNNQIQSQMGSKRLHSAIRHRL